MYSATLTKMKIWKIFILTNSDLEDIYLDEFSDEIDQWVIDALKAIGCDTARSVLAVPRQDLIQRTDLEEETIDDIITILKAEFEDE
jgi:transcription termination/antitermination protein NusA